MNTDKERLIEVIAKGILDAIGRTRPHYPMLWIEEHKQLADAIAAAILERYELKEYCICKRKACGNTHRTEVTP